jgi:Concanavalin A-like lectin/glucanases superfamily
MALSFNGSSYLAVNSAIVTVYPFTMSCWVIPSSTLVGLMCVGAAATERWATYLDPNGAAVIQSYATTSTIATSIVLPSGQWSMVTGVFASATSRTIYVNGGNDVTDTNSSTPVGVTTTTLAAGTQGDHPLIGSMAYPAIWKAAFAPTDVANLYARQFNWTNSGAMFNWTNNSAPFGWTCIGTDPRTIQSGSVASFTLLQGAPPFVDTVTGTTWTVAGSPLVVADPFQLAFSIPLPSGNFGASAVSFPRRVLRPFHATNRF